MLELYNISFTNNKNYNNRIKYICYICLIIIIISISIWYIFFSEPYKIYLNDKIQPIQYLI